MRLSCTCECNDGCAPDNDGVGNDDTDGGSSFNQWKRLLKEDNMACEDPRQQLSKVTSKRRKTGSCRTLSPSLRSPLPPQPHCIPRTHVPLLACLKKRDRERGREREVALVTHQSSSLGRQKEEKADRQDVNCREMTLKREGTWSLYSCVFSGLCVISFCSYYNIPLSLRRGCDSRRTDHLLQAGKEWEVGAWDTAGWRGQRRLRAGVGRRGPARAFVALHC